MPFIVHPPEIDKLERETSERIKLEKEETKNGFDPFFKKCSANLSKCAKQMMHYEPVLP